MLNFIYSDDDVILNYKISILNSENIDIEYISIANDNLNSSMNKIIEYNLFNTKKIYVLKDLDLFTTKKSKLKVKQVEFVLKSLNNAIHDVIVLLNKELLFDNPNVTLLTCEFNYFNYCADEETVKDYLNYIIKNNEIDINSATLNILKHNLDNDLHSITNELIKLSTYDKTITKSTIAQLSYKSIASNAFDLIDYIINDKYTDSKLLFDNLIKEGSDPVQLLGLCSTQIKFIYQIKLLDNFPVNTIASKLKANNYRTKITHSKYKSHNISKISKIYKNMANIDYKIKSGQLNSQHLIDYLLI